MVSMVTCFRLWMGLLHVHAVDVCIYTFHLPARLGQELYGFLLHVLTYSESSRHVDILSVRQICNIVHVKTCHR